MVPSLKKVPILATGRLHGPLKIVPFAQDLIVIQRVSSCEGLWVLPFAWLAAGLRRSAFVLCFEALSAGMQGPPGPCLLEHKKPELDATHSAC